MPQHALEEAAPPEIMPMSEVTDNHAIDLDPYNLTDKVTAAANKTAEGAMDQIKEVGVVRQLWSGLLDDLFGSKRLSKA
ncbi:MAG: hypothetical protein Q9170_004125 [Blastenia crenularia]